MGPPLLILHFHHWAHCLPMLLYSSTALSYTSQQLNDLNACWNSVYRRIFGFNKWDSVRTFIAGLGRMEFISIHAHLGLKFYKVGCNSNNLVFSSILKRFMFTEDFKWLCNSIDCRPDFIFLSNLSVYELKNLVFTSFCNRPSRSTVHRLESAK